MITDVYLVNIIARRTCRFCHENVEIEVAEPVVGTLKELSSEVPIAIDDQQDDDGWQGNACPQCTIVHAEQLHREYSADDDREDIEYRNHSLFPIKIPQILIGPPDWLAVLLSMTFGALWLASLIVLKNLLH